ncbi:SKU5 similar 13 [Zea mays]|uniref:SKU5 similar 13 n=1 Tax=Zea mays TaxID=4577 RepID=A0A1D6FSI5_MAIZE|nr:SKU5 similar 13 [Zea mays]
MATSTMRVAAGVLLVVSALATLARAEDPYLFFEWKVTYGTRSLLGVPQKVILINGEFPGPRINCSGHGEPAHDPGVPAVMDGDHADIRQRGHVERPVQRLGAVLPRGAVLHQRHLAGAVAARRVQHARQRPPLRQGRGAAAAAILRPRALKTTKAPFSPRVLTIQSN